MSSAQVSPVELAGAPPLNTDATGHGERISGIDVLRGFSLLGILVLNIDDFGGTRMSQHDVPIATIFYGPRGWINYLVFCLKWIFFEGKMRGIFSMLFGAGVLLLTTRAEKRGAASATNVADIFTRRNLYLMLFGLLHGLFIWRGDILFIYGFAALLFIYPLRRLKPSTLLWTGTVMGLLLGTYIAFGHADWHGAVAARFLYRRAVDQNLSDSGVCGPGLVDLHLFGGAGAGLSAWIPAAGAGGLVFSDVLPGA
jgi:uncharacterized membrane protein YeiB